MRPAPSGIAGNIEDLSGLIEIFGELFGHADVLRTMAGKEEGCFHVCGPYG
jgi:hypothetical protein